MTTQMEIAPAAEKPRKRRRPGTLEDFLHAVKAWGLANAARLARMYVVQKNGEYFMYVVPKGVPYDPELTKSHAQFGIELWDIYRISAHGMQIPDMPIDDLPALFDPTDAFILTPV